MLPVFAARHIHIMRRRRQHIDQRADLFTVFADDRQPDQILDEIPPLGQFNTRTVDIQNASPQRLRFFNGIDAGQLHQHQPLVYPRGFDRTCFPA
jgi:hypothetical protein